MIQVLVSEFLSQKNYDSLSPVLLFCPGKAPFQKEPFEPLLAERAVEKLVRAFVDPSLQDMVYSVFYADETPAPQIVLEAQTLPFLAERRVIVVRNAGRYMTMSGEKGTPLAALLSYLDDPSQSTLLIFVSSQIDKRKRFYKACQKLDAVVECPQLSDAELSTWVRKEAENRQKSIEPRAITELLQRAGGRLSDINNALGLVCNFIGERDDITEKDIIAACADVAEESVWALTDAIAASNPEKALSTLYQLTELGKSPDEIMGLINWLIDSAYRAAPQSGVSLKSQFVARKVMPLVQKLGLEKLKAAFALCTDTHFMIRSTGVDKMLALELLVIKLSAPRKRRRRPA